MDITMRDELLVAAITATVMHHPEGWDLFSTEKFLSKVPSPVLSVPRFIFRTHVTDAFTMGSAHVWKPQVRRFLGDKCSLNSRYTLMYLLACRGLAKYSAGIISSGCTSVERLCDMHVDCKLPTLYSHAKMSNDADRKKLQQVIEMHLHLRTVYGQSDEVK